MTAQIPARAPSETTALTLASVAGTRGALRWVAPLCFALACGGAKDDEAGDTAGESDGGDAASDGGAGEDGGAAPCPDIVPEEYRFIWDCALNSCPGGPLIYNSATGESRADGSIEIAEQWFVFTSGGACVDTFQITGQASDLDPNELRCSGCEGVYEVEWTMTTGNTCQLSWGGLFIDDNDNIEGPYAGYLMFDTHTAFGDRNPDNAALVVGSPVEGRTAYLNPDWGRGTATPAAADQPAGPPETYTWTNGGLCANGGAMTAAGGAVVLPGTGPLLDPAGRFSLPAPGAR